MSHVLYRTRGGSECFIVLIDVTPFRDGIGPSGLLDMLPGRSKEVFKTWLEQQAQAHRDGIEADAVGGSTGSKTAAAEKILQAVAVMEYFHLIALAGDTLDGCRQRIQQATCGHRGHSADPPNRLRGAFRTGANLLTDRRCHCLNSAFSADKDVAVHATCGIYQMFVEAQRNPDLVTAKEQLASVITDLTGDVPVSLTEIVTLGRTPNRRAEDVLVYFDRSLDQQWTTEVFSAPSTSAAPRWDSETSLTTSTDR